MCYNRNCSFYVISQSLKTIHEGLKVIISYVIFLVHMLVRYGPMDEHLMRESEMMRSWDEHLKECWKYLKARNEQTKRRSRSRS